MRKELRTKSEELRVESVRRKLRTESEERIKEGERVGK